MIKGWYEVSNQRYYSKVKALLAANNDHSLISYQWMPEVWDNTEFSLEPTESWKQLLQTRCKELRSQHDWLQLFFSGGWDSTTILDAFAENGISLDEIIIFNRKYVNDPEISSAIQYAIEIKNSVMSRVKITVLDVEHDFSKDFYNEYKDQWFLSPGTNMKFNRWPDRMNMFRYSKTYMDSVKKYKNVGLIEGKDKPRVLCRNSSWYAFFVDGNTIDNNISPIIDFFYDTKLHVKQVHMACRWFESKLEFHENNEFPHQLQKHETNETLYKEYNIGIGRTCTNNTHAIYGRMKAWNENNSNALQSYKISRHEKSVDSNSWKLYSKGIKEIQKLTGINLTEKTLPDFITKQYYIKPTVKLFNSLD